MTIRHVALFRLSEEATEEALQRLSAEFIELGERTPGCRSLVAAPSAAITPQSWDFGLTAVFESEEAFLAYRASDDHATVAAKLGALASERASFQMRLDGSTDEG